MRRYRAFIAFAVISVLAFYHFSGHDSWGSAKVIGAGSLRQPDDFAVDGQSQEQAQAAPAPKVVKEKEIIPDYPPPQDPLQDQVARTSSTLAAGLTTISTLSDDTLDGSLDHQPKSAAVSSPPASAETSSVRADVDKAKPSVTRTVQAPGLHEVEAGLSSSTSKAYTPSAVHWSKQPEHFPVTSTIQLPTGTPKVIPRIQHTFDAESEQETAERKEKLSIVKEAAVHSWRGYRDFAFGHDEIRPVTGGFKDPFCGWAATMVDALDTLWIMGMKDEFEEAVRAVGKIDFTTSPRKDIPLFETTIRYLGGLLAAYDVSDAKYITLLDKAVELAEVLMGAFDTPNRMPMTFYHWMPAFASQPHRAGTHVVMAEIGSLSMEFTRLAQLTKEPKYYDAIDRITDAFYEWQQSENGTLVPGLFSTYLDASGCDKPAQIKTKPQVDVDAVDYDASEKLTSQPVIAEKGPLSDTAKSDKFSTGQGQPGKAGKIVGWDDPLEEGSLDSKAAKEEVLDKIGNKFETVPAPVKPVGNMGKISGWDGDDDIALSDDAAAKKEIYDEIHRDTSLNKRQLGGELADSRETSLATKSKPDNSAPLHQIKPQAAKSGVPEICVPQGLASSARHGTDSFTLGGRADSTYEYLPKEYLLLGGLESKYQTMYEKSMDAAIEKLLFRPMTPDNQDILFSGEYKAYSQPDLQGNYGTLKPAAEHLACFAGGMFAMSAKIFGRKADLDIGARLTEGCVWAYNATATGIMPEQALLYACDDINDCTWNETKYWDKLDPYAETRTMKYRGALVGKPFPPTAAPGLGETQALSDTAPRGRLGPAKQVLDNSVLTKRQVGHSPGQIYPAIANHHQDEKEDEDVPTKASNHPDGTMSEAATHSNAIFHNEPVSHEDFVKKKIEDERLPPGFTRITSRKYILRQVHTMTFPCPSSIPLLTRRYTQTRGNRVRLLHAPDNGRSTLARSRLDHVPSHPEIHLCAMGLQRPQRRHVHKVVSRGRGRKFLARGDAEVFLFAVFGG